MKIKFLRPFRLYNPIGDDMTMDEGAIDNMEKEDYAQWLIDNGFAEEVKEPGGWKPEHDEEYFYIGHDGLVYSCPWGNDPIDNGRLKLGLVFKTEEACMRCRDYLEAIATVRQDEGVLTPEQVEQAGKWDCFWYVSLTKDGRLEVWSFDDRLCHRAVGAILFDNLKHARDSIGKHPDEWKTIAKYKWGNNEQD